jgi:hypothetical protein
MHPSEASGQLVWHSFASLDMRFWLHRGLLFWIISGPLFLVGALLAFPGSLKQGLPAARVRLALGLPSRRRGSNPRGGAGLGVDEGEQRHAVEPVARLGHSLARKQKAKVAVGERRPYKPLRFRPHGLQA